MDEADVVVESHRREPTETDLSKATVLELLAEGKPYIFLTAEHGEDEAGQYVLVNAATSIDDGVVLKFVLDTASSNVDAVLPADQLG